ELSGLRRLAASNHLYWRRSSGVQLDAGWSVGVRPRIPCTAETRAELERNTSITLQRSGLRDQGGSCTNLPAVSGNEAVLHVERANVKVGVVTEQETQAKRIGEEFRHEVD